MQLCAQLYSSQAIEIAKKVLFSVAVTTRHLISRRGADKSKNNAHDILRILLEQKKDGPVFTARDPGNIPPVDITNVDISHLLREIQLVKSDIQLLAGGQSELVKCVRSITGGYSNTQTSNYTAADTPTVNLIPSAFTPPIQRTIHTDYVQNANLAIQRSIFSREASSASSCESTDSESSKPSVSVVSRHDNPTYSMSVTKQPPPNITTEGSRHRRTGPVSLSSKSRTATSDTTVRLSMAEDIAAHYKLCQRHLETPRQLINLIVSARVSLFPD